MEIVIRIEDRYKKQLDYGDIENGSMVAQAILDAVKNGTPLPKGHGRLKDVDKIITAFPCGEVVRTEAVRATLNHEPTIIEADKGSNKNDIR